MSEVRSLLGCDRVAIWQVQPDGSAIAVAESAASNRPSYLGRQVEDSCLITNPNRVTAYSNGRIRVVPDIYTTKMSDCHREFLAQLGIRAKILVPIVQGETLWGMLSVIESQAPRQWQTGEIGLLEQLATQLAIALQQATALQQAKTELAERQRAEAALQWQIQFDRLIASISSHFVQFSPENMTNSINQALQDIGEFTQVDTSYIFQYSETQAIHSMTHEWVAQGIPPQRQNAQNIPDRAFPWATAILRRGEIVHIPSFANLPVEAAIDRQSFQEFQIESILNIPLVDREKVVGFLGLASFHREHNWTEDNLRLLKIFAEILLNALQRQQAEAELQSSEQRYASLAKAAPVGIFRSDTQGSCVYVNDRWCQMTGLPAAASLGTGWAASIYPGDRDQMVSEWQRSIQKNSTFQQEFRVQHSEGQIYWVFAQAVAEYDAKEQIIGYVGTITDISDRKRAEEELQQKNTEMQAILAIFPDLFFRMAADGTILDYKARNTSDLYVPPEFFLNKRMQEVLPPNVAELISATIAQVLQTKLVISLEYSLPIGDREEYFEARFISFQEDQIVAIVRNISDRKAAEAALSQSEQRLQALLQHSSDIVSILDEQGNLVYNSPAAQRIHGFLPEDILGRNTFELIHPDDRSRVAATFSRLLEEPASKVSVQYRYMTKEKGYVWMEAVASNQLHNPNIRGIVANSRDITERKLAEQALQDSENRLSNLIANLPGYVYRVANDPNYTPEFISEGVYQITGYRQEEYLLTRTISCGQEIHPDDAELIWNLVQQALERRQPYECEYRIITKTGETKWVWERGRGCWTQSGELLYLEGFVTDISDRKQAEATRLQAEKLQLELTLLEKILDIVLAGYWDWDIPNHKKYMSPGLKRMFGYEEAELPNALETWQRLIFPEDLPGVLECFERHVGSHGEIPYYNEVRYRHKNGSTVWVICSGQVIEWDEQGNPLRMIGCHIDITKRKQAEVTMRRQLAAIEAAIEGIGILQGDTYLYLNQAYLDLLGYERPEELLGKPWRLLYAQEEIERFEREVFPVLGRDRSWQGEAIAIRKDGSTFAQGLSLTLTDDGLLICVCRDISDRKQAEEQIREKTLQLEATNRELESFSYSVSHDLRAPLRHINGFVNALRQQLEHNSALDNPKVVRYLETIENSSQRMALLIDGLLTLSRMGRRQIEYQPVKLRPLVEEAISFVQSNPGESTPVKFVLGNLPAASGDATLLQQVFCNLIGNAVKFSRNHPDPLVEIGSLPDNTIFVKDNGVGFSMDYADKLFGAFQRLHSQKEFEGTGIGLAIVQRIIHRHGGTIWAESQPDQGATFYFTIGNIKHDFPK